MMVLKNKQGWITVACAFVLQGLTHGLASSMGVFYIQWHNTFPSSSTLISTLASSVLATILCTAPIAGAVSRKAGIRLAIATGGALAFCGFICTSFVHKASYLFITVALMIGFGSSVVYMSSVIAVSNHFKKNFATAAGISNAGASVGVLILPILFEVLVSTFDWRRACLIIAAIQLHIFVCMMIIKVPHGLERPIERFLVLKRLQRPPSSAQTSPSQKHLSSKAKHSSPDPKLPHTSPKPLREAKLVSTVSKSPQRAKNSLQEVQVLDGRVNSEKQTKEGRDGRGGTDKDHDKERIRTIPRRFIASEDDTMKPERVNLSGSVHGEEGCEYRSIDSETGENRVSEETDPPEQEKVLETCSQEDLDNLPTGIHYEKTSSKDYLHHSPTSVPRKSRGARCKERVGRNRTDKLTKLAGDQLQVTSERGPRGQDRDRTCSDRLVSYLHSFLALFDIQLLWTNLPFSSMVVPFFLGGWFWGTILPHLAARAVTVEIDMLLASSLISIIGAGNLISRMFYGRLVDSGWIHPLHLYIFSHACTSASSLVIALGMTYPILCLGALGVGIGSGIYIPLMQPVVRCLVGTEKFAGGFGLSLLSVGIGNYMSATIAGLILDVSQNYTLVFLLPTCVAALSSCILIISHLYWGVYRKHPNWPKREKRPPQIKEAEERPEEAGDNPDADRDGSTADV